MWPILLAACCAIGFHFNGASLGSNPAAGAAQHAVFNSDDGATAATQVAHPRSGERRDDKRRITGYGYDHARDSGWEQRGSEASVPAANNAPGRIALGRNMRERVIPFSERTAAEYYKGTPRALRWLPEGARMSRSSWNFDGDPELTIRR